LYVYEVAELLAGPEDRYDLSVHGAMDKPIDNPIPILFLPLKWTVWIGDFGGSLLEARRIGGKHEGSAHRRASGHRIATKEVLARSPEPVRRLAEHRLSESSGTQSELLWACSDMPPEAQGALAY
jgi:hypothetical protein